MVLGQGCKWTQMGTAIALDWENSAAKDFPIECVAVSGLAKPWRNASCGSSSRCLD